MARRQRVNDPMLIVAAWLFGAFVVIFAGLFAWRWLSTRYKIVRRKIVQRTPWDDTSDPSIGWVYAVYDDDYDGDGNECLLYIGSAKRTPFARLAEHALKEWWPQTYRVEMAKHANYAAAHDAERYLVRQAEPLMNKIKYAAGPVTYPQPMWVEIFRGSRTWERDVQPEQS